MKKFIMFFTLVAFAMSIAVVGASAATNSGNTNRLVSAGIPCDMLLTTPSGNYANISSANVWIANNGAQATTRVTTQDDWRPLMWFNRDDAGEGAADVLLYDFGNAILHRVTSTLPFNPWNMTDDELSKLNCNIGLGVYGPVNAVYTQNITRTYNIRIPYQSDSGQFVWGTVGRTFQKSYSVNAIAESTSYVVVPLFVKSELNQILSELKTDGYDIDQAIVSSIDVYTPDIPAGRLNSIYLNNTNTDDLYATIRQIAANSLGDLYEVSIAYDNLDWSKWLKNAVGGFMSFEIVPGLPLYGIVSAIIGIPLLIWFLRLFAGG